MADYRHPAKRKPPSVLPPPQLPVYSSPPKPGSGWSRFEPFVDNPPDYPESSEEADADESDQEVPAYKRRHPSPQAYLSPFQSSPRKTRRPPHQFHSPSPSLTSYRPRHYAKTSTSHHAATNSDSYLDSLLARSVHALELSNTLLQSSLTTPKSPMTVLPFSDSPTDESPEESATGLLSKRITKSKELQRSWIADFEEIGKRVDSLFGEETETEELPRKPSIGRGSNASVQSPTRDAATLVSQSLPISSGLPPSLSTRQRGKSSSLTVGAPTPEGQLTYSAHSRNHFVDPPPRALTVYIGSDDADASAIKLPPTLGIRSPQLTHSHLFQSPAPSASTSPVLSMPASFSNGQNVGTRTPELSLRAHDILSSYVTPQRGSDRITRSQPFGSNASPVRPINTKRTHVSPTRSEGSSVPASPKISRGRSLSSLKTIQLDPSSNSPSFTSKPLTPPIEELSNSSSESDSQTNFAVTSLRKIYMDDQALAMEREKQLSASRSVSNSTTGSRMRPPPRLLAPTLPEVSTSHATASVTRLLTKNKHSSSTRPQSPPLHSSLRSPSRRSLNLSPGPSPSASLLNFPRVFGGGSGGSNNGSGRSTPNRVSFAALPESYANSKPGGPDEQFNRERRRKRNKSVGRTPLDARSSGPGFGGDSDDGSGWGRWTDSPLSYWYNAGHAHRFGPDVRWDVR